MKCPICNQEVQPLDHQERWGPEFAHSRCIIAFNAGSAVQDAKLQTRIKRLEEALSLFIVDCDNLHHSKKHQHGFHDPCPVVDLILDAKEAKP